MSELETALAELVERDTPGTAPPFAGVRRRARVRSRMRVAAVAGVLVAAAAVATVVTVTGRPDPAPVATPPVDGPAPERITHREVELRRTREVPLREVWIDRFDRTTLVVEAGVNPPDEDLWLCAPYTVARVLAQDSDTVRVAAYAYEPVDPEAHPGACPQPFRGHTEHRLHLGAPVEGRTVLNGQAVVAVRDPAKTLTATGLPAGYTMPGSLHWSPHLRESPRGMQAMRLFPGATTDDYVSVDLADPVAEAELSAMGGQPSVFGPVDRFTVEGRPTVRGHEGVVFTYGPSMRCLRWRESTTLTVVVCSHRPGDPLPTADLLTVAEGLRPGP